MYYRNLVGFAPAPSSPMLFKIIHPKTVEEYEQRGWKFCSAFQMPMSPTQWKKMERRKAAG